VLDSYCITTRMATIYVHTHTHKLKDHKEGKHRTLLGEWTQWQKHKQPIVDRYALQSN